MYRIHLDPHTWVGSTWIHGSTHGSMPGSPHLPQPLPNGALSHYLPGPHHTSCPCPPPPNLPCLRLFHLGPHHTSPPRPAPGSVRAARYGLHVYQLGSRGAPAPACPRGPPPRQRHGACLVALRQGDLNGGGGQGGEQRYKCKVVLVVKA